MARTRTVVATLVRMGNDVDDRFERRHLTHSAGLVRDRMEGPLILGPAAADGGVRDEGVGKRMPRWVLLLVAVLGVGLVGCDKPRVVRLATLPCAIGMKCFPKPR